MTPPAPASSRSSPSHQRAFVVFWGERERDPQRVVERTLDGDTFELGETVVRRRAAGALRHARRAVRSTTRAARSFGDHITLENYALSAETLQRGDALQVRLDWQTDAPLTTRYKVFLQLLDANGVLVAQRDSEPGGGLALTTTWTAGRDRQRPARPADRPAAGRLHADRRAVRPGRSVGAPARQRWRSPDTGDDHGGSSRKLAHWAQRCCARIEKLSIVLTFNFPLLTTRFRLITYSFRAHTILFL